MNTSLVKLFIGMPVYNGERFLRFAIDSIRGQTYTNWTLFIADDASTDSTRIICEEYAEKDSRISYHRNTSNKGLFENFNYALTAANTPYFMWAAQDDIREKDYLEVCMKKLEQNPHLGLATTCMAAIDSYGRTLIEEPELVNLSGKPGFMNVARYVLQPEILGKCNLMYGVWRTDAAKTTWEAYPHRRVWGPDYMFCLGLVCRFEIYVDPKILWKKRLGGYSSPLALDGDRRASVKKLVYKNPKNHIFPFGRFKNYFAGHMEASRGTPYSPLVALLLLIRLPRSFFIFLKERNYKKYIRRYI